MSELLRPALYGARHTIVPLRENVAAPLETLQIVGPVCETTDALARDVTMPLPRAGDLLAILTAGAYGMVMASQLQRAPAAGGGGRAARRSGLAAFARGGRIGKRSTPEKHEDPRARAFRDGDGWTRTSDLQIMSLALLTG